MIVKSIIITASILPDIFDTNNSLKKLMGMKTNIVLILIILSIPVTINAFSPSLLTDVQVKMDQEYLIVSYNIDNFQDGINIEINIFQKISKKIISIKNDKMRGNIGIISQKEDLSLIHI